VFTEALQVADVFRYSDIRHPLSSLVIHRNCDYSIHYMDPDRLLLQYCMENLEPNILTISYNTGE